jgi:hypothetical protein
MIKLHHPLKWANNYFMDENSIPFMFENGLYMECSPISPSKGFVPRVYNQEEVDSVTMENP